MARILAEKTESTLRQVIHFAGVRPFGEAQPPLERIDGPEPTCAGVEVTRAVVVEAKIGVELFTGEQVVVGGGAGGVDEVAEGVVVRHRPGRIRQRAHRAVAIVIVIAERVES